MRESVRTYVCMCMCVCVCVYVCVCVCVLSSPHFCLCVHMPACCNFVLALIVASLSALQFTPHHRRTMTLWRPVNGWRLAKRGTRSWADCDGMLRSSQSTNSWTTASSWPFTTVEMRCVRACVWGGERGRGLCCVLRLLFICACSSVRASVRVLHEKT